MSHNVVIKLEPEQVDEIVVAQLKDGLMIFEESLSDRQSNENALFYFSADRDQDIKEISAVRDAFTAVLSYYDGSQGSF